MNDGNWTRREFVKCAVAAGVMVSTAPQLLGAETKTDMPMRTLGRTGEKVSAIGLGGFHAGSPRDEQETIRLIRSAIDRGINFMDNCWE